MFISVGFCAGCYTLTAATATAAPSILFTETIVCVLRMLLSSYVLSTSVEYREQNKILMLLLLTLEDL